MIKLTSEHRGLKLGCALTVTKANHMGAVPVFIYELEFDEHGLIGFARSSAAEWRELEPDLASTLYGLLDGQEMSLSELAAGAKVPESTASYNLRKDFRLEYHKVGTKTLWRRKVVSAT